MSDEQKQIDDGGPAFPLEVGDARHDAHPGMSLRDYFAAKAMQAYTDQAYGQLGEIAEAAYSMADAMLAARKGGAS